MSEIYRFIRAEKAHFTILLLCAVLGVARSSYYAREAREQARSVREREDLALVHEITVIIHVASKSTYGVPRIHAQLRRQGRLVNRKRVERLMREHGIAGHSRRAGHRTLTRADRRAAPAPNQLTALVKTDSNGCSTALASSTASPPRSASTSNRGNPNCRRSLADVSYGHCGAGYDRNPPQDNVLHVGARIPLKALCGHTARLPHH
ncbi:IS3 family transposase [Streptomyces sp. NBC_00145]